ncbi:hypothetical protein A3G50_00740 [Candidatus Jorgensenbacteria bacterium RIFCSPLOWO2_12_FULL_42_11]|uniref:Pyruvate phosphate dikinase AMP/ATP-binding domain-containing protein n=1 Tax=Candidatus Jorgensenbacteria bacterium RIFCSPLOWO2_12_FULL_42_11 TaxID=1798473 RepID=A0A1F6C3A4_9BACT|nr:MAG: hypothetical protein A3G50_00740 [Candidatus Jorgensenbacteria bacterium RIFCSPLOWO2_12_FULL_42_11]
MIYFFGGGKADGNESLKNLLGGKGANLAEMAGNKNLELPVPPGFTITTEVCAYYQNKKTYPDGLKQELQKALKKMEKIMTRKFGDPANPLLVSVRSGARKSICPIWFRPLFFAKRYEFKQSGKNSGSGT